MCRSMFLLLALSFFVPAIYAAPVQRRVVREFTTGWRFLQSDAADAQQPAFDDSAWKPVTLPHDWAIGGPFDKSAPAGQGGAFLPAGTGWYRKSFTVSEKDEKRRTFIVFDGAVANSDVWINGYHLGHRPYGYVSFVYDMTGHLNYGPHARNVIAVRCDNSKQPASRWYSGAGINRQVRLVTVSNEHIVPWGTFVTTPEVSAEAATIHVRSSIVNQTAAASALKLSVALVAPDGHRLKTFSSPVQQVGANATADLDAEATIARPDRWDLDHPVLYTVHAVLLRDGKPVDDETVPFGIREFHFDADKGFFLNGRNFKIKGAALHTDAGALGTAVPLDAWRLRLTALRKLGVNAIRTAHNPPAPEFLDLADRMGFLVMDEMFDCWTVGKNPYDYHLYFRDWSLRDTADSVRRDRNHPSIILWSAGNEIHDTPHPDIAIPILKSLVKTFHENDPTRPVTQALFRPNVSHDYDDGLADLLDVVGQNYREKEILAAHAQKPSRKIIGTENTHDRNQWVAMRDNPEYSGQFIWVGADYLGEAGRWPRIGNGSGLLDRTDFPHPVGLERESWWSTQPNVHMVRRVAPSEQAATDPGYEAVPPRFRQVLFRDWSPRNKEAHTEKVEVYTNAERVELTLNGRSLGVERLHPDASPLTWEVPFVPGVLKATAMSKGKVVAVDELRTAGAPARLELSSENGGSLSPDWNEVRQISVKLVDANGTVIPDNSTVIHFSMAGPGQVIGVDNGSNTDHDSFEASERKLFEGRAIAIVRAKASSGDIALTAAAEGVPSATIHLKAVGRLRAETFRSF